MDNNINLEEVTARLGSGHHVSVPLVLLDVTGDMESAALVYASLNLMMTSEDKEGWFPKTGSEWQAHLRLTPKQLRRCVKTCSGIIEVKRAGKPAKNFYRVNVERLQSILRA